VEIAVVGDGETVHPEVADARHEIHDPIRAVQERELGVGVEVYESHGKGKLNRLSTALSKRHRTPYVPLMSWVTGCGGVGPTEVTVEEARVKLCRWTVALVLAAVAACGGDGIDLPVPANIALDPTTNGQQAFAGAWLPRPLAVTVTAADGLRVTRAQVRWTVLGGVGATVADSVTVTDGDGRAEVAVTLGATPGSYEIRAALVVDPTKTAMFTVEALAAPQLTGVAPATFSSGDTVVVQGTLLSDTLMVEFGSTGARVIGMPVPGAELSVEVPECLVPGAVSVRVRAPGWTSNEVTATYEGAAAALTLAVGEYQSIDPGALLGCAAFPQAGAQGAEYLLVPQSASPIPGVELAYELVGDSTLQIPGVTHSPAPEPLGVARQFHDFLRAREEEFARLPKPELPEASPVAAVLADIEVGDRRSFKVCNIITCSAVGDFTAVTARARYVGTHAAIYVDLEAPDTLTTAAVNTLGRLFDEDLYAVASRSFGAESDIDRNGRVLILMTPVVNGLTPQTECETSIVTGFFFAIDIDPSFRGDSRSNQGEVFYALAADPQGTVGCEHAPDRIQRIVPVTFAHELQHMISYNQHVLVRGKNSEVLWLNEAMSHLSEEVAALHFESKGDATKFSQFAIGNLFNAYLFLKTPADTYVLFKDGSGSLAERGGAWLFLRWVVDQFGPGAIRRLSETGRSGADNVMTATGEPFERLLSEWILASWAADLPGFSPPPRLTYTTWNLRTLYQSLHDQVPERFDRPFPIVPLAVTGGDFATSGMLRSGSGAYILATQTANQSGFVVTFRGPGGTLLGSTGTPRLNLLRIR
jgi:hypothetical protein